MNPPLPELQDQELTTKLVAALFRDVDACTEVLEVIVKGAATGRATSVNPTVRDAQASLLAGEVRGVQLRYRHQGQEWWDTVMRTPSGFRLVRIAQQFD